MKNPRKYFYRGLVYGAGFAAAAYFAYLYRTQLADFYHHRLAVGFQRLGDPAYPFLSWTLFALLAMAMIFLIFQAWQEQNLVEVFIKQLKRENNLLAEKGNFLALSSHYLRTPLALVTNGIELMSSLKVEPARVNRLSTPAGKLKLNVESLLAAATQQPSFVASLKPPRGYWAYMLGASAGAFIAISLAVYILANPQFYSQQLKFITGLAAGLVIGVIIYSAYRGRSGRQALKDHYSKLIIEQRTLDAARNDLIKNGLEALRTPISQLHAELAAINNPKLSKPVIEGLRRFEAILQKFVIVAGLQAGSMTTIKQPLELSRLIEDIERRYSGLLQRSGLSVDAKLRVSKLNSDPLLLEYVIESLVNNAVKYGGGGQPIMIQTKKGRQKSVDIFISDKGPGIPQEKLSLIFKPFSRAEDTAANFEHEGIGLSLYLDRLIMQYLGGAISAQSSGTSGATFKLAVPA
jgi:signal transduction histidine kinase